MTVTKKSCIGTRYVVTKASDDGTFEVGDHIFMNADRSISNIEAQGWIEASDAAEASKGIEIEVDKKWADRRKKKLAEELVDLNERYGANDDAPRRQD